MQRTSGSTDALITAMKSAWFAVAVRAAIGSIPRERTWWPLAYVALFFLLPLIASGGRKWW